jgi:predicted membrane protein
MKVPTILKTLTLIEIVIVAIFILYIVFPVPTPTFMASYVESPLGMILILCTLVYLFVYTNPILAILFIFVGYELLRRSGKITNNKAKYNTIEKRANVNPVTTPTRLSDDASSGTGPTNAYIQYTQPTSERESEMQDSNIPINQPSLEVEVVDKMAPVGKSETLSYMTTGFKPVADNLKGAANF